MKKIVFCLALALACARAYSAGSISVPLNGIFLDFSLSGDPTNGWSTFNFTGAGNTWNDDATLDGAVQPHPASDFNLILPQSQTLPPSTSGAGFRYNYATSGGGQWIQSRPTGDAGIALLGTFVNNSGADQNSIDLAYDFAIQTVTAGQLPGWVVYYSLTGAASSWTQIPFFTHNVTVGNQSNTVALASPWSNGGTLYLLWVDDNADGVTDESYTLDNFSLSFGACEPATIASQPVGTNVLTCEPFSLSVTAAGSASSYQWYKDNNPIGSGTNRTYSVQKPNTGDSGNYFVRVSWTCQGGGTVQSSTVHVGVTQDTTAPTVLQALLGGGGLLGYQCNQSIVLVRWDKLMDGPSISEPDGYNIIALDGGTAQAVASVVATNGTNAILTLAGPLDANKHYQVQPNGSQIDCSGNQYSGAAVDMNYEICLLSFDGTSYHFYTNSAAFPQSTDWRLDPGYDDTQFGWDVGTSVFDHKTGAGRTGNMIAGHTVATQLPGVDGVADEPVYLFRTHFNLPTALSHIKSLHLYTIIDDFDALWFNNIDTVAHLRPGFPAGVEVDTNGYCGGTAVGDAAVEGPFNIDKNLLVYGDNLACAKQFQVNATSSDATFAHQLVAVVDKFAPPGPSLTIVNGSTQVTVTWSPAQDQLYKASSPSGPWTLVSPQSAGSATVNRTGTAQFFSVRTSP